MKVNSFLQRAAANPTDTVSLDVPLLIRLLEYAREDAQTDMDLHYVAERLVEHSSSGKVLTMADYNSLLPAKASNG